MKFNAMLIASLLAMLAGIAGCSSSSNDRYTPAPKVGQDALFAALEAWRQGDLSVDVQTYEVPIKVADTSRRPGQKLKSFDILGEVSVNGGRIFQVRLQFEQPEAEEKAQYVVVGIDPLWVFRREDYDMVSHWEHGPVTNTNASAASTDEPPKSG